VLGDRDGGAAPVLADVLVPRAPDPALELDGRVLVERGELGRLGLGHQQPLGVVEHRQQGCIHLFSPVGSRAAHQLSIRTTQCRAWLTHRG